MQTFFRALPIVLALSTLPLVAQESSSAQGVRWMSFEEAVAAQKTEARPVLIDFYTVWCGPCKMLEKNTFQNPVIAAYINQHFYAVKFNAEGNDRIEFSDAVFQNEGYDPSRAQGRNNPHDLTRAMAAVNGNIAYPTVVYLNAQWEIITPVQGYLTPKDIEPILHFVAEQAYLSTAWDVYSKDFKSSF